MESTIECKECKHTFQKYSSNNRIFCSKPCYSKWQSRTTHHGFITLKCEECGTNFIIPKSTYSKHIKASPQNSHKLNFCSRDCSTRYFADNIYKWRNDSKGENNPAWRGGVSEEKARLCATKRYQDFVEVVLKRDNYQCRVCASTDRPEVHHIIPFHKDKTLFLVLSNGITLCNKHHNQTKQREEVYINIFNRMIQ